MKISSLHACTFVGVVVGLLAPPMPLWAADRMIKGRVVVKADGQPEAGLQGVKVRSVAADDSIHDDVAVASTNGNGEFTTRVPDKYATFSLLFVDGSQRYWPRKLELSPTHTPWTIEPIQLQPQTMQLSDSRRIEVERIQQAMAAVDPAQARGLYAQLNPLASLPAGFDMSGLSSETLFRSAGAYRNAGGALINYQSVASGSGLKQISAKTVTVGVMSTPASAQELKKDGLVQWPVSTGGVRLVVNLNGTREEGLVLDGATLAAIYLGQVTTWNDTAVKRLNPKTSLPDVAIKLVHRADGSAANAAVTEYLSEVSEQWRVKVGKGSSVAWPGGVAVKGNEGMYAVVSKTLGAIGYLDYSFASQENLSSVGLVNMAGNVVRPSRETLQAAIANAGINAEDSFTRSPINAPGARSWPLTTLIYVIVSGQVDDAGKTRAALEFFSWTLSGQNQDELSRQLDLPPLPDNLTREIRKTWTKDIKDAAGKPVWR